MAAVNKCFFNYIIIFIIIKKKISIAIFSAVYNENKAMKLFLITVVLYVVLTLTERLNPYLKRNMTNFLALSCKI